MGGKVEDMGEGLVAFLRARLDEDEATARAVLGWIATYSSEDGDFAERFGPARVLREVEARRAILDRYEDALMRGHDPMYSGAAEYIQQQEYEDWTLPALAAVYRDHPDYDEAWKP